MKRIKSKNTAVLLMCKMPVPGQCKTRMKPGLNDEECAALQEALIYDIVGMLNILPFPFFIAFTPFNSGEYFKPLSACGGCFPQAEGDLGNRMEKAAEYVLKKGYAKVIIIGSDSPGLQPSVIIEACEELSVSDVCIGPCEDGGYYLIGMKGLWKELFEGVSWGTEVVFQQTMDIIKRIGCKSSLLPMGYDLDRWEDLIRFKEQFEKIHWEKRPVRVERFLFQV